MASGNKVHRLVLSAVNAYIFFYIFLFCLAFSVFTHTHFWFKGFCITSCIWYAVFSSVCLHENGPSLWQFHISCLRTSFNYCGLSGRGKPELSKYEILCLIYIYFIYVLFSTVFMNFARNNKNEKQVLTFFKSKYFKLSKGALNSFSSSNNLKIMPLNLNFKRLLPSYALRYWVAFPMSWNIIRLDILCCIASVKLQLSIQDTCNIQF